MKFRQFKPSFSEEFERPSNAGCKQNFNLRPLVREAPQALVDQKRDPRVEGIHLRIPKSPESNTWGSTEAQNQGESSMRFANPGIVRRQLNCIYGRMFQDWFSDVKGTVGSQLRKIALG